MFALFALMLLPMFYLSYSGKLGSQFQINPILMFIILLGMLILSFFEIPVHHIRTKKPTFSEEYMSQIGELFSVPMLEESKRGDEFVFKTAITLNIGGFVLPLIFAIYVAFINPGFAALEIMLIMIITTHMITEIKSGIGVVIPDYIGLIAIPFALILDPGNIASVVLVSGVIGILISVVISMLTINENTYGSAFFNIGGPGNFKAIYITVLIAVLLSYSPI